MPATGVNPYPSRETGSFHPANQAPPASKKNVAYCWRYDGLFFPIVSFAAATVFSRTVTIGIAFSFTLSRAAPVSDGCKGLGFCTDTVTVSVSLVLMLLPESGFDKPMD